MASAKKKGKGKKVSSITGTAHFNADAIAERALLGSKIEFWVALLLYYIILLLFMIVTTFNKYCGEKIIE